MSEEKPNEKIHTLEIKLKHLQNDFDVTREEFEGTTQKYLDILQELKEKNYQLMDLQKNLENLVKQRTSQLEQTRKILQQKSEELQTMIDSSPAMIFYKDRSDRYVRVNKAFAEFAGVPIRKLIGKTDEVIFKGQQNGFLRNSRQAVATGEPILNSMETVDTGRGRRDLLVNSVPYKNEEGVIEGIIGFALDVTAHRQLENEQSKAGKLESIGVLAGGIAHDFNNILTAILGNISLGQALVSKDEEVYRVLKEAENACLRARDLTNQLLTFARGGTPLKKTTSLKDLIMESAWFSLRGSNVRCYFDIAKDLWKAEVDEEQISRVINNLIINADQAMPDGGTIDCSAANVSVLKNDPLPLKPGKFIRISIQDHGHGISKEDLPRIFDPFFTTREKSNGLGVTTAWSIVKKHGGHIAVESEMGQGTRFDIYLPSISDSAESPVDGEKQEQTPAGKILVVDDEEIVRDIAGKMLTHFGHSVVYAANGEDALKIYQSARENGKPFDLVILDLTIPGGMGGVATIQRLKELDPDVKAIVSSGYSNDPVISNYEDYGFCGVVTKPYNVEDLKDKISLLHQR